VGDGAAKNQKVIGSSEWKEYFFITRHEEKRICLTEQACIMYLPNRLILGQGAGGYHRKKEALEPMIFFIYVISASGCMQMQEAPCYRLYRGGRQRGLAFEASHLPSFSRSFRILPHSSSSYLICLSIYLASYCILTFLDVWGASLLFRLFFLALGSASPSGTLGQINIVVDRRVI